MIKESMKERLGLLLILLTLAGVCRGQELQLKLIVPRSSPEGDREIYLPRYPRIHAMLTNVSDKNLRLWKDWNSWGWDNLILYWSAGGGKPQMIRKIRPGYLDGDFSDFWTLKAGESLILEIDMSTGEWDGFPDLYGEKIPATLFAIYQNKADFLSKEFGVWTGQVKSSELKVIFR